VRGTRGASRLPALDRVLLAALLCGWGVAFALHTREVARTGLASSPVFAVADPAGGPPRVGGLHLTTDRRDVPLVPGDRLLRVGDVDLDGVGALGFDAHLRAQAGAHLRSEVEYERAGERRHAVLRLIPEPLPWFRIPTMLVLVAACTLVLVRGGGSRGARLFFAAFMSYAIQQAPFRGSSYAQTVVAEWVGIVFGALTVFLVMRWATFFPDEVRERHRISKRWSWLAAALFLTLQADRSIGTPLPPELLPRLALAAHAAFLVAILAIVAHNFRHADPIGRRRAKWVLYGSSVAIAPSIAVQIVTLVATSPAAWSEWLALSFLTTAIAPFAILIAIARYNLYDIDLLIRATASYSLLLVLLLGAALAIAPLLAGAASTALGVETGAARLVLAVALAAVAIPLYRRLRPRVDRAFFPERVALERGVEQLLRDLSAADGPAEVLALVGERVAELLRPETCVCWVKTGTTYGPVVVRGPTVRHEFPAEGRLTLALELHERPLVLAADGVLREADLGEADVQTLRRLHTRVLAPLRTERKLSAFFAIGPKTSGDVYTPTDLTLLASVATKASAELLRIQRAAIIRGQRLRADQLRSLRAAAEEANVTKSRFFAAASHDLRQPLHALGLFVETLQERAREADDRALVAGIRASTDRLSHMFNALLDLSRLDAGRVLPHPSDLALEPILARACAEVEPEARARGLRLRRVSTRAHVHSDPNLLPRLIGWLIENAVRHTERGGVLVGCRRRGESVRIEVWDTGPGIPDERRAEIFQEFATLDADARPRGLGLGLTLVERTAQLLGHPIELDSRRGRGSVFSVSVPRARPRKTSDEAVSPPIASALEGRRVLVIDDDPDILEGMGGRLERWGCHPLGAPSADAALALLSTGAPAPDAILADYRLAGGSTGLEAIDRLRAHLAAPIPAVVITGETAPEVLEAIRAAGFQRLSKPVSPARLRALLERLLRDP
jgi:signal transduction histidine kinase